MARPVGCQEDETGNYQLESGSREIRIAMRAHPRRARDGEVDYWVPARWMVENREAALVLALARTSTQTANVFYKRLGTTLSDAT